MMTKRTLWWTMVSAMLLVPATLFTSCSDDDDNGGPSTQAGIVDSETGLRLTGFGNYSYSYDSKGRLSEISSSGKSYEFTYNPNKIIGKYEDEYEDVIISVGYNGAGYLSSYSESWVYEDWSESGTASFSYDGSGHLTKISGSWKGSGIDDGERYSESGTTTWNFTWSSNRLTKVVVTDKVDGHTNYTETTTFSYNGDYDNPFRQWTPSLAYVFTDSGETPALMSFAGLLGVGPSELPSALEYEWEDLEEDDEGSDSYNISYSYNSEGAVRVTRIGGASYTFYYDYADSDDDDDEAPARKPAMQEESSKTSLRGLFTSHRHRNHHR